LKIHLEREKKKADEVERGESKSAHDDEHANELLSAERQKHQQELKDLHSKLDVMEKQLLEKDAQVKRAATKAAFLDPAGLVTGGDRNGMEVKTEGNIPQISGFQQTPAEMLQSLHWAQERARRLQVNNFLVI
jgi:hypothetical protein